MDIDKIIGIVRTLKEESAIANVVGTGEKSVGYNIETETPPVDLRKGKRRNWNPFFKDLARMQRRKPPQ